jgi:hypothetical protein
MSPFAGIAARDARDVRDDVATGRPRTAATTAAARRDRRIAAGVQASWLHGLASGSRLQVASRRS